MAAASLAEARIWGRRRGEGGGGRVWGRGGQSRLGRNILGRGKVQVENGRAGERQHMIVVPWLKGGARHSPINHVPY